MYEHNIGEIVEAGVTVKRDVPTWIDREGNIVSEPKGYSCEVTSI